MGTSLGSNLNQEGLGLTGKGMATCPGRVDILEVGSLVVGLCDVGIGSCLNGAVVAVDGGWGAC